MSDYDPEQFAEFTTQDGPGSADVDHPEQVHPEQEAHGGSMAPGIVDANGEPVETDDPDR